MARLTHLQFEALLTNARTSTNRHDFTTMLDAGVGLRGVQITARHADPRTTMLYDRARKNLDRHLIPAGTASTTSATDDGKAL